MPFRQRGSYGRSRNRLGSVIDSNKNVVSSFTGVTAGTKGSKTIVLTVDAAANANATEVTRGCKIFRIWVEFWAEASAEIAVGTTVGFDAYIIKNPGNNLTTPTPGTVGTSNEKKFVFKIWKGLMGTRTQGGSYYSWKGWIKVPRVYQRMGADDLIQLVFLGTGSNVLFCSNFVYKWYK